MRNVAFGGLRLLLLGGALALAGCTGADGKDGTSCTVKSNADGTKTISCTDGTSATVTNGAAGAAGAAGATGAAGAAGTSCSVRDNGNGTKTITCGDGTTATVSDGTVAAGSNVRVDQLHGESFLLSTGEYAAATNPKTLAKATITSASADAAGVVTMSFKVTDLADKPVTGLKTANALVAKLVPGTDGGPSRWVDYFQAVQTVSGSATGNWPNPDGTKSRQGSRESNGTLTDKGNGEYTYKFAKNISAVSVDGVAIPYQRNLTHRVQVMMGGHSGFTAEATYDFVPDGSAVTTTRDIVPNSACVSCHGIEFHGHGGDRLTLPGCVTCHSSDGTQAEGVDPQGGQSIDMTVMTHKIHAGAALPSAPGPDGVVWDDPATPEDESADNVEYAIWGRNNTKAAWGKAEFPAVIENCTACHQGSGAQVANWKNAPSRKACGSCHDNIDFAAGVGHMAQANDSTCKSCHPAEGTGLGKSVTVAHDFMKNNIQNIAEFGIDLKVSTPANGQYFVTGEAPLVTVVLSKNGVPIDHTTVVEDGSAEGCTPNADYTACNETPDGKFRSANMYVTGPRANRVPVLTMAARAKVLSATTGPFDLSANEIPFRVVVDSGMFTVAYDPAGEDRLVSGDFTVTLCRAKTTPSGACAAANTAWANPAQVTVDQLVAWLNSDKATFVYNERDFVFGDRAIAYKDEATGKLAIRSRPTIANTNIQVPEGAATSLNQLAFTDHAVRVTGGAVQLRKRTDATLTDPKAFFSTANISYLLDPIDGYMKPGTYVINVEFADLGRVGNNYRTPSVAVANFQVGQAAEEKPIAANCTSCHWSTASNTGYVLDYPRHNKIFNSQVMDQCGGCHDYASAESVTTKTWTTGGSTKPISRRVHSIHNGANLNYPVITVDHEESVPGRNWDITYPMDVRNCQSCHPDGTTTGSWATNPNRIACMGCHDSDAATAHIKLMTYDPTPSAAWSGDEEETCKACH